MRAGLLTLAGYVVVRAHQDLLAFLEAMLAASAVVADSAVLEVGHQCYNAATADGCALMCLHVLTTDHFARLLLMVLHHRILLAAETQGLPSGCFGWSLASAGAADIAATQQTSPRQTGPLFH
ncbi:hypothetical protein DUNSADRAFT_14394 [Dunaliella salina]|uniref:Secreted protein n=1 Tax=Dunaliella salina TaxID=3046 RepID=A0ABQ7G7F3_DUNSA|nr:hypothetical protein DUNSADRAFT_14394 [Dunaliella salina]|eukprot:KAF5830524.1 hypothetical protein DUNSADRAFT_14394 [Dunaliella salina]